MLKQKEAGPQQVVNEQHLRRDEAHCSRYPGHRRTRALDARTVGAAALLVAGVDQGDGDSGRRQLRLWKWLREKGGWEGG